MDQRPGPAHSAHAELGQFLLLPRYFTPGAVAQVWRLTSSNNITRLTDAAVAGQSFATSVPAQSVTLFVVPTSGGPANQLPLASATATPATGTAPLVVALNGSGSSDPDGTIASYAWSFGDGGTATGPTPSHTYVSAGSFSAQLTVTDNQGATGTTSVAVVVSPAPTAPAAPSNLTASVGSGRVVTLRWIDNASNETGVYVERATKAKTLQFARIATLGANVPTYARVETAGTWVYRVQAYNAVSVSAYSNNATIRVR